MVRARTAPSSHRKVNVMSTTTHTSQIAGDRVLIAGLEKHLQGASLVISNKTYTMADIVKVLQHRVDAASAIAPSKATWQADVKAYRAERLSTRLFISALRQAI